MASICSYCLGARSLLGPNHEDETCPSCLGFGVTPVMKQRAEPEDWRRSRARLTALEVIGNYFGRERLSASEVKKNEPKRSNRGSRARVKQGSVNDEGGA
jgi:hypothetical protein